jgi:hypothetical protein
VEFVLDRSKLDELAQWLALQVRNFFRSEKSNGFGMRSLGVIRCAAIVDHLWGNSMCLQSCYLDDACKSILELWISQRGSSAPFPKVLFIPSPPFEENPLPNTGIYVMAQRHNGASKAECGCSISSKLSFE